MKILKTWVITAPSGWIDYLTEVSALTSGRTDVKVQCKAPGVISIIET